MSYIEMTEFESSPESVRKEYNDQIEKHGRITNMKRTLLHNLPSFKAYMEWYTLYDELLPTLGSRALSIFSYAISTGNDCLVCGSFFTKILKENEEDVNCLQLNGKEQLLFDFGNAIARDPHNIPQEIYDGLKSNFTDEQIVTIIAFAGLMCATNLFNTVAKVDLDEVLYEYRIDNKEE